jgi:hypothetical protein
MVKTSQTVSNRSALRVNDVRSLRTERTLFAVGMAVLVGVLALGLVQLRTGQRLLLAPMIGALDNCLFAKSAAHSRAACGGPSASAVHLIEATLQSLGPQFSKDGRFELGYTLNVPLLRLFNRGADGGWHIDTEAVRRVAHTIRDIDRPAVLYLFSTHFGVGGAMEAHLAQDAANLAHTPQGPLPKDKYYDTEILPWSVARTDNELTLRREQAMRAVLAEVCAQPSAVQKRVKAVTVLGEVHQLFPGFEAGMGFESPYRVTDYSEVSRRGFQRFLAEQFGQISRLNAWVNAEYPGFDAVEPPARDIRTQPLRTFHDHIDAYAGGRFPVSGWASVPGRAGQPLWMRVYVNGQQVARVPVNQGRQDVFAARPDLPSADVGWRHDVDFSRFATGLYQVDMALESPDGGLQHLGRRAVGVLDRTQLPPAVLPQTPLPAMREPDTDTAFYVDSPKDQQSVYFNPLVPLWHGYRASQVTAYLAHMGKVVQNTCLGPVVSTHQIIPFTNPGWDESRFAINDSLRLAGGMGLGISLYGEPIYGDSLTKWLNGTAQPGAVRPRPGVSGQYGITEFHPLKPLDAQELREALLRHWGQGAYFVSFFLEPRWEGGRIEPGMNLFSLDPQNPRFASDRLYQSFSNLLRH